MTAVAERPLLGRRAPWQALRGKRWHAHAVTVALAVANAIAFIVVQPDVNDLWAARARATAVLHGVGLTYWFSWFGGGSTPGSYSIMTPWLSALISAELLCALSAVAVPVLCAVLLRGRAYPIAGTAVAAFAAGLNLWSGRVPFLFGSAIAIGAMIAVQHRRQTLAVVLAVLSIFASPVSGAFLAVGLAGVFLTRPDYRRIATITIVGCVLGVGAVGLVFGAPGPEPFSLVLVGEGLGALVLLMFTRPPDYLRGALLVSFLAIGVLALAPNGLGGNFDRFIWFWLPAAAVALGGRRLWVLLLAVVPMLAIGTGGTIIDLHNAAKPISTVAYYQPLAKQLDTISDLRDYRVEVVNHGAHAAYDALLGHAALARGWETQEDNALNSALKERQLDPVTYKVWLDNNAVGYVALPTERLSRYSEYKLVSQHELPYLKLVWRSANWRLFEVQDPTPIVAAPATMIQNGQSKMTIRVPCACEVKLRVRWSKFLHASKPAGHVNATVTDDGSGWTVLRSPEPGVYELRGSLKGLLH